MKLISRFFQLSKLCLMGLLLGSIALWKRLVSPLLGHRCRFYPTCSEYASEAVLTHGLWGGGYLALRRLLRCNPLFPGGADPVPPVPIGSFCEQNKQSFCSDNQG